MRRVRKVAHDLDCQNEITSAHMVFHVSILKKYIGYSTSIISLEGYEVKEKVSYEEVPVRSTS